MKPWERLDQLIMYLHLKDHEFKMMFGIDRDELFEIHRKIPLMNDEELKTIAQNLFINPDYLFGKSESIIPNERVDICLRLHFDVKTHQYKPNRLTNK